MVVRQTLPGALFLRARLGREAPTSEGDRVGTLYCFAAYRPDYPHPRRPWRLDLSHFLGEV
jgi:hypothetical protein